MIPTITITNKPMSATGSERRNSANGENREQKQVCALGAEVKSSLGAVGATLLLTAGTAPTCSNPSSTALDALPRHVDAHAVCALEGATATWRQACALVAVAAVGASSE